MANLPAKLLPRPPPLLFIGREKHALSPNFFAHGNFFDTVSALNSKSNLIRRAPPCGGAGDDNNRLGITMKKTSISLGMLLALSAMGAAHAATGMTVSLGTTGAGLHISMPASPQTNFRFGVNGLSNSQNGNTDDVDYDFKLKLSTVDALVDYFPMGGAFRLSGGISYNGNQIDVTGRPAAGGTYTLNDHVYPASAVGTLNGQVTFRKVAPYLGIGWGNAVATEKGWGLSSDIGVLLQGAPQTALSNHGCTAPAAACAQIATDVAAENRALADETSEFKAYPVVRIGVSYKF
jgi:hypothetical protein